MRVVLVQKIEHKFGTRLRFYYAWIGAWHWVLPLLSWERSITRLKFLLSHALVKTVLRFNWLK
jgi:hypothetical protein